MTKSPFNVDALNGDITLQLASLSNSIEQAIAATTELVERINSMEGINSSLAKIIESHERRIRDLEIGRSPRRG